MEIKGIHIQPAVCNVGETVTIKVQVYGKLPATYQELKKEILSRLTIIGPDGIHEEQNLK